MECPSCRHVCREEAAKFCSQCGKPLPRAAPAPESENNPKMTSVSEGEMECGQQLKEEGGPTVTLVPEEDMECGQELKEEGGPFPSLGLSDQQESLDEPGSWTTQKGPDFEVCVDAAACSAGELEAANRRPSKRRKEDASPLEAAADGLPADPEQSKSKSRRERRKRKNQTASASMGPESSSPSMLCSLDPLADPGFQDAALPPGTAQQGGLHSQPSGSLGKGTGAAVTPGGHRGSLLGPAVGSAEGAAGSESPGSVASQGPTPKATEGGPGKEAAAQELPPPKLDGAHSEPRREPPAAPTSGAMGATAKAGDPKKGAKEKVQNETQKSKPPPTSVPASREHHQGTEPKGETAVSGEKAQPGAPKKAAGAPGQDVAAEKKVPKDPRADARGVPESPLSPGEGVTVFFHAIISKDFGFQPGRHRVFVRGGEELGEPRWRYNVCEMHCIKDLDSHGYLVEGSTAISKQHLDKPIPYKYVVDRGEDPVEYEFIYEKQKKENTHIDRCLHVKSTLLGRGGWHQYDDIACKKPPGMVQRLVNFITDQTRKDLVRGKKLAAGMMLDSLLGVLRPWSAANLSSFFTQFRQFYSVIRVPMIHEAGERPWSSLQYEEKQVQEDLWEHLRTRAARFLHRSGDPLPADFPVRSRLRMGLVILSLVQEFKLPAFPHDLSLLCDLLCCDACSPGDFHADLSHISETPQRWREALVDLCHKSVTYRIDLWVGVLPVFHHCTERPACGGDSTVQQEVAWAALEGIPFKEFREKRADGKKLLHLMQGKKHLLDLDAHLFRSWFSLLPLDTLVFYLQEFIHYLSRSPAHVLDCLLGTFHRLQGLKEISNRKVEEVRDTLKMLLHLLDMFQDNVLEKPLALSYPTVCLKLHQTVCRLSKDHLLHELLALSAKIVRAVVSLKPLADSADGKGSKTGESSVRTIVQTALNTTKSWLRGIFNKSMFQNSGASALTDVTFTYKQEMQVWRQLVEIDFPAEHGWRESLLRDMEGRLKQESPRSQILAFCSVDWKGADAEDGVAKCFENCVIEAISSACQSQTSVLEGLSCVDLHRFGTLVSTVITKSWPRDSRGPIDDPPKVLKHLLTGPDIKHLFRLYGSDEKLLKHFTEEGKTLMAAADSIITEVARDLLSGTVLVGQLELIWSHRSQFLDIWELKRKSLSPQEKKQDMQQVLRGQWEALAFLQEEKRRVDSLLKLCEGVRNLVKVDFGEIARRHSEDLSGKRLNGVVMMRPSPTSSGLMWVTHYCLSPSVQEMAQRVDLLKDSHIFRTLWEEAAEALHLVPEEEEEEEARPSVDIEDVYEELYRPCLDKFCKLYEDLKSGELTLAEVDTVFKVFVDRSSSLAADLSIMCALDPEAPRDWVPRCVKQIREYQRLQRAGDVARVIQEVRAALGLTGDFEVLDILLRLTDHIENFHHGTLNEIDESVVSANSLLEHVNEPRFQALQELAMRREFIAWVRGALGGIHELKVFVDLASISAGENDIDVDRVACFHDAVQGYACLLYKLDASAGFQEFMDLLKELWKALENDPHLPRKLCDSARNLEWLKTVKESHGSVELSSLSLATAINSRGIYVVQAPADGELISPDTVLRLVLPESHGAVQEEREYSLEELKELLNKLMLMSGRKDQNSTEVEVFSEVFSNMERLVHAFINLYCAGNLLFRDWRAEVCCSPEGEASVQVDFGWGTLPTLEGRGPLALMLEAICWQMERFLRQWEDFVAQKRAEHFHLNYYTAEQLVYLSTQLLRHPPEDAALTLLSFIKPDCSAHDVWEACRRPDSAAAQWQPQTQTDELLLMLRGASGLADELRVIMEQSLTGMCDFLPHCLDLEGLGRCLASLATKGRPPVTRELPKGLQAGQPNLVVCGPSEVLLAALAVYMHSPQQPLPTYDEVLLCTPDTTFEEVALLLRRCLSPGARGRGVYSLLHADQLGYEAACRVEALFQSLCVQPHREGYQLVLVCDSEREHCYLPSAFSRHKVPVTPQASLEAIQDYLAQHYHVPERTLSAAAVFRDRMCVGIVASERAGVGKSLYVKRLHETLQRTFSSRNVPLKVVRLVDRQVGEHQVLGSLLPFLSAQYQTRPMMFHFDVTSSVETGIWAFLFKLLILQHLTDINGKMWLRNPRHLYVIEILERHSVPPQRPSKQRTRAPQFSFLDIFPKVTCRPPKEVIGLELHPQRSCGEPGMDQEEFRSETFQRPFQYLKRFHQKQDLDAFRYQGGRVEGTPGECIQHLLIYCGVVNPSWSELWNFARFLNYQLKDCEASVFCNPSIVGDTLRGFKNFVVTFMIFMARDFATPTLHTSDQSPGKHMVAMDGVQEEDIAPFSLRRRWESEPHPYVFFNGDHTSMTFIGFHLQPNPEGMVDAIDPVSKRVIKKDVMTMDLYQGLLLQRVPFNVNFDQLPRHEKLERLCMALGIQWPVDPDDTYELTTDNMLKILAIEMRFRCGIPVIIMGETGCGKTRLIRFLSDLRRGCAHADTVKLVKVHGGTTADMIYARVQEAESLALVNKQEHQLDTVLFFDEANTTEAVSCIKEVLCDHTVGGRRLAEGSGLHIIAACNPYRKHSPEMISRLEAAGLGYRVRAEETADRLGCTPLRQLVYRVHALPPSLTPLVWDFGQLNDATERLYIQQIVQRLVDTTVVSDDEMCVITDVLSASQHFMRKQSDECSFVSLRDVERCVRVFRWFHERSGMLLAQRGAAGHAHHSHGDFEEDPVLWALVLAVGVCYHASLERQESYRKAICRCLPQPYNDGKAVLDTITRVQDLFLEGVPLRKTIAKNLALKENVFMMVVCIELRIPLFLVGKPGSSKSLAKTIVADAMQGQAAHSDLFRNLKQVHLVSFQCSPHSTPQGIIGTFRQCARFQQDKDLRQYVSVVVLDEVGLAEDSPKMPLKALHPLLEDGCIEDDPAPHKKVGFIGISNWALDPAKMNRGIFVSRGSPNTKELIESAKGICSSDSLVQERIKGYFAPFAKAYERVCQLQGKEFFGLRDYYSLIKMVFASTKASNKKPSPQDIAQAVLRNFSGKDGIRALDIFAASLPEARLSEEVSTMQLVEQNVYGDPMRARGRDPEDSEARYLLLLTRNYVALQILQRALFRQDRQPEIIFGSSFPRDQEYTQICRNVNRVKVCMETGRMVVLLNLQNLYESLYDALNQYYVHLGGQKYVDLGLGTHRVKCRVHPDFRLIVIEEKDVVYNHFPIPLINRLEKHYLDINTVLETWQRDIVGELKAWVDLFVRVPATSVGATHRYSPSDVFMGYHSDTCASVVLQVIERLGHRAVTHEHYRKVLEDAKLVLLDCATPDAVVRLSTTSLGLFAAKSLSQEYYYRQQHDSFADFLQAHLRQPMPECHAVFTEITTFSRLLTGHDSEVLAAEVTGRALTPTVLSLQQFDTEHAFLREVRKCVTNAAPRKILIIQTDFEDGVRSAQLIASAKFSAMNEISKHQGHQHCTFVYFITKLSRMESGRSYVGSHGGLWRTVHIDDLRRSTVMVSDVTKLQDVTISQLFDPDDGSELEVGHGARDGHEEEMEVETHEPGSTAQIGTDTDMETDHSGPQSSHTPALDTGHLLRSCVQSAVGLLQDPSERSQRNVRRVEVLLGLLSEDDAQKAAFSREVKRRLHDLLRRQETFAFAREQWVQEEASNPDALQEAGTFRHTLWKRVQGAVTPLLASMISIMDRDGNLELLAAPDAPSWTRDLWMFIFSDLKLLNIPLVASATRRETSHILVLSHMQLSGDNCNSFPFSWRIKDYVDELGVQAQYVSEPAGASEKLLEIFRQTPLGCFLARLPGEERQQLLRCYLQDFLLLTMKVSNVEELMLLQMALCSCVQQLREESPQEDLSLPWVHLAYQRFRIRLQNFSRILTIHPPILDSLTEAARSRGLATREMTLDVSAALACVELLLRDLLEPSPQVWLQTVKKLSMPLELLCSDGYLQDPRSTAGDLVREIRTHWNRIFSVALFVEHVLLGTRSHLPELQELVTESAHILNRRLQGNSDIKTLRPFRAVMQTLCECKERASNALIQFKVQACPVCLGDAHDPVHLPCDHVFCLNCVKSCLTLGQMSCPLCLTDLPEGFSPKVSQEMRAAIEKHARFRHMCTSFFVDLVSTVCFKDNCPPDKDVVDMLLSLLFVEKKLLLRGAPQRHREHTKSLSPFNDVVDKTPVIRSVVLKLLLKYSFREVKGYIQDYLTLLEKKAFMAEDKTELYLLFTSCLEDSMHEKSGAFSGSGDPGALQEDVQFLRVLLCRPWEPTSKASVEGLQEVARVRLCLDRAADVLAELRKGSAMTEERKEYLRQVERFCTQAGNDWYRVYLVRKLTSLLGMESVQGLSRPGHPAQWVFPKEVIEQQRDHPGHMDHFLVHGQEYKAVRDAVGKAVLDCKLPAVETALQACRSPETHRAAYLLLALFREVASLYRSRNASLHPTPEQCEALRKFIEQSQSLSPDMRHFATSLVTNALPLLRACPRGSNLEGVVTEMAIHAAVVFLCGQHRVLEPLKNLAFSPATMARAFLPTMPEDLQAQARRWKGLEGVHWYTCPKGHHCAVGECGRPMERSFCIDCRAPIGGKDHRPEAGFTTVGNVTDRTQTGHVLGSPPSEDKAVVSDRELPPVVFLLARLLTHLALFLGATHSRQAVKDIIRPLVEDPREFLEQHIHRDVRQLTKSLGRSADDTAGVVHLVLRSLLSERRHPPGQGSFPFDEVLSTKEQRNSWEKCVETLIVPELEHLDKALRTVNTLLRCDERISSNPVAKLVFGDPVSFLPHLPQNSVVHSSKMWSCRTRVTVEYLQNLVEQKNGKETVPVLWKFLQKDGELRLVKFLPEILALQRDLVKWFQNASEAQYPSICDFIESHSSDGLKQLLRSRFSSFLSTWNKLRRSLETHGEIKLPQDYCSADLDLDSKLEVVLPRRQGLGLCSTALVSYLISLHNEMVYTVAKFSEEENNYSVDASEVTDLHVISYEVERDLTPLILSNCQYQVEQGGESLQEFDLEKIQRQLTSRFLQGKPRLTLRGLPTLVCRRDWNFEHLFTSIRNKVPQVPLPNAALSTISGQLQSHSDACEALSVIEVTLGFLSTAGEDPNMDLIVYIQDKLRISDQTEQVLKALHRCQLRHVLALWQLLSAHKSEQQLRLRREPFGEISADYRVELSQEGAKLLRTFLNQGGLDTFLLELHELMVLKLKNPQTKQDFNPNWSLRDTLVSYMETKDGDVLPEMEAQFPEDILLSNCVSAWKVAVELKRGRQMR
ncbi:E3 ubiquitin-protein ligase RNF213 [Artibeus jamaicensis]|uniref:E3 ubiquitin-protein ligase RNF213 n=1 Tax=Artibeus jamaicensis TaxID=9417 RepID=UPI00235B01B1|nr:E3 ubiquitin-protein ligase RNF213 [Artibeus jamaicensis]